MRMTSLITKSKIDRKKLDRSQYMVSLLQNACELDLMSQVVMERIQMECLELLAKQAIRSNSGDSSSLPTEKAKELMASINFTISLGLKEWENPDDALEALETKHISDLYDKGYKKIEDMVTEAKAIYEKIMANLFECRNVFYRGTIIEGIPGFFKIYYPQIGADQIHITADYPVYNQIIKFQGIEFIYCYLKCIYYENEFCSCFDSQVVHYLLSGYDLGYEELVINIYGIVLASALGCKLTHLPVRDLALDQEALDDLQQLFKDKDIDEIGLILQGALDKLQEEMKLPSRLARYMKTSITHLAVEIMHSAKAQTLDRLFIIPEYPEQLPKLIFSYGEKMEDEQYRTVIKEIMAASNLSDKIAIIKNNVGSLADMEDVLLDCELTESEIVACIKCLQPVELAALGKKYRDMDESYLLNLRESEILLSKSIKNYILTLPNEQQDILGKAMDKMEERLN